MAFSNKVKKSIRNLYGQECFFCGYSEHPEVLEAAHIVKEADNPDANQAIHGILLCPTCHAVYDKKLFCSNDFEKFKNRRLNKMHPEMKRYFETGEWPSYTQGGPIPE